MALADIYQKATLVQIPSGYKAADAELYSVVPNTTVGDFTVSVAADATRVNKDGLIESVAANQARLDYDPSNPQDPTLLLEPIRRNLIDRSEEFNLWSDAGVTVTPNATIAPNGTQSADKLVSSANNWRRSKSFTAVSGIKYTVSVFAKLDTTTSTTKTQIEIFKGASGFTVDFDLPNKLITGTGFENPFIEEYPNGWYRIGGTYTADGTTNIFYVYPSEGYSVSGTMFFWGAQLEDNGAGGNATYPSSYIPTSGSAVTRTQDRCISGGNDALFNDSEGVLFADLEALGDGTTARKISLSDGSTDFVTIEFTTVAGVIAFSAGSTNNTFFSSVAVSGQTPKNRNKIAIKYKSGNTDCFINGTKVLTRTEAFTLSGLDRVNFENRATSGSQNMFAKIHQLMVFNEALTDAELITLTT